MCNTVTEETGGRDEDPAAAESAPSVVLDPVLAPAQSQCPWSAPTLASQVSDK